MRNWTVDDVMTKAVVSVAPDATYREVVDVLVGKRVSAVPVVDGGQRVIGVVSEADLLRKIEYAGHEQPRLFEGRRRRGRRVKALAHDAGDLMSEPAVTVPAGTSVAAAARLMDSEAVKRLPVVDDLGRLIGIVTRVDLLKTHLRPDDEILADVRDTVLRGLLAGETEDVTAAVAGGVVTLRGRVDRASTVELIARLTRQVAGVVQVVDELEFVWDDRNVATTGLAFGVA